MPVGPVLEIISTTEDNSRKLLFCLQESLILLGVPHVGENYGSFVGLWREGWLSEYDVK